MITYSGSARTIDAEFIETSRAFLRDDFLPKLLHCVEQMPDEDIWWRPNEVSNSIGNLILHLCGNIRQWIVAGIGGGDFQRNRDAEFTARGPIPRKELVRLLQESINAVEGVLAGISGERLLNRHHVQKYDPTELQMIYHVVEHFSYHLGQILYIYKLRTGADPGFYRDLSNR